MVFVLLQQMSFLGVSFLRVNNILSLMVGKAQRAHHQEADVIH
jgi:hypothetical protein